MTAELTPQQRLDAVIAWAMRRTEAEMATPVPPPCCASGKCPQHLEQEALTPSRLRARLR